MRLVNVVTNGTNYTTNFNYEWRLVVTNENAPGGFYRARVTPMNSNALLAATEMTDRRVVVLTDLQASGWQDVVPPWQGRVDAERNFGRMTWAKLVEQLRGSHYVDRVAADRSLRELGQIVIPYLRSLDEKRLDAEQLQDVAQAAQGRSSVAAEVRRGVGDDAESSHPHRRPESADAGTSILRSPSFAFPPEIGAVRRFIAGDPIKPATKAFAGLS